MIDLEMLCMLSDFADYKKLFGVKENNFISTNPLTGTRQMFNSWTVHSKVQSIPIAANCMI